MNIEQFIKNWNNKYPFDHYFRKKYNIPFGSKLHKEMDQISMSIDFKESLIMKHQEELSERQKEQDWYNDGLPTNKQIGTAKESQKVVKMTKKELDNEFDNLDLSKFNDAK